MGSTAGMVDGPFPRLRYPYSKLIRVQAQATPWYHFIPMQYTYSDLFDILSFFDGSLDGKVPGRNGLAEEIAGQGREFALNKLR
jgi:hypothetical protein